MSNTRSYDIAVIRDLLTVAFDDPALDALCQDHFPQIHDDFGRGMRKGEKITLLLDHVRRHKSISRLLTAIQTQEPEVYADFAPRLFTSPAQQDSPRVVNLRPLDMARAFRGRICEIRDLCSYLADDSVRLISIVGRAGMGKTALACHVLAGLERGVLPDPDDEREFLLDGILYLGARDTDLGLDRIYSDVARMLGEPAASQLTARWAFSDVPLGAKVRYLLEILGDSRYLILLDNLEDHQTNEGVITDEDLRLFVEHCLTRPSRVRLVITSRVAVKVPATALRRTRCVSLREGLSEDDAVPLLRDLDPQGSLGLRDAAADDLQRTISLTQGIPRALEILAGILHQDPTTSLPRLLADEELFGEQVVEQLVAEGYRRLGNDEQRVMETLAVFNRPVGEAPVVYLLQPWFPDLDARISLRRLANSYFVHADRATGEYSLHPLDREYVYRQLPDDKSPHTYARCNLELRAADYYASIRKPENEWKTIEDLASQLAEFAHRVRAGDYDAACHVLNQIDYGYLILWGHYGRLAELREMLVGHPMAPGFQVSNLDSLGHAYRSLGRFEQAITLHTQALSLARGIGDRQKEGAALGNLGRAYHDLGQSEQAITSYEQALAIAREAGDRRRESALLGHLGRIYRALGQFEQAIQRHTEALWIAREISDLRLQGVQNAGLGLAYRALGQFDRAIQLHTDALSIARQIGDRWEEESNLGHLGFVYHCRGWDVQAIDYYEQALALAREISDRRGEGIRLSGLGSIYHVQERFEQAIQVYEGALTIAREIGERRWESYQLLGLGRTYLAAGSLARAQPYCVKVLALDVAETSYLAALVLGIILLHQDVLAAGDAFADATARCRARLVQAAGLYEARYALAAALVGQAVCNPRWTDASNRTELLAPALPEYCRALENCAAPGVVQNALRDLELIRAAGIEGLEPVFELLESAILEEQPR